MVSNDFTLARCSAQRIGNINALSFGNPRARIVGEVLSSTGQTIAVDISPTIQLSGSIP
jgi:hypothetical protein